MKFFNPLKKRKTQSELLTFDSIVESYKSKIGKDFNGYRNHCYRVFQFCQALSDKELGEEDSQKLQIALAFHDLGLFTDNTVDYLPPSMTLADEYLAHTKQAKFRDEILLMIEQHHKITAFDSTVYPLVELLRQADLVDFSLGMVKFGLDKDYIKQVKKAYPNKGFHKMVVMRQMGWLTKHPNNPFPIFKL